MDNELLKDLRVLEQLGLIEFEVIDDGCARVTPTALACELIGGERPDQESNHDD